MEIVAIIWVICGLASLLVSQGVTSLYLGMTFGLLAFLLGPFALLIALLSRGGSRPNRTWE